MTPLKLLEKAAQETSQAGLNNFVFGAPILLKPEIRTALRKEVGTAKFSAGKRKRLRALLDLLQALWTTVSEDPVNYYVGVGPLELLANRVSQGEISIEAAEKLACAAEVTEALSRPYLLRLSGYCRGGTQLGKWRQALPQERIIRAAVSALPVTENWEKVRDALDLDWIEIVHGALIEVPDGRWLSSAIAAGNRVMDRARTRKDAELIGEISHLLGTMYLDPYSARFSSANYHSQIDQWLWRLRDALGQAITWIPPAELQMPTPVVALNQAVTYLTEAVKLRAPKLRPLSAKALDQAIQWLQIAGGTVDPAAAQTASRAALEALHSIDRHAAPHVWVQLFAQLASKDETLDFAPLYEVLKTPLDDFVDQIGGLATLSLVQQAASALATPDPSRSLELFRLSAPLVSRYADAKLRTTWLEIELNIILRRVASPLPTAAGETASLDVRADALRDAARAKSWRATELAATLLLLAASSGKSSEEAAGLRLLDEAESMAPIFAENHAGAFEQLRATLLLGEGVNGYSRGDWAAAIQGYSRSLARYLHLRLDGMAMEALRRINDLTSKQGQTTALELATGLMPLALRIEANLGDPGRDLVVAACKHAVGAAVELHADANVISLLWQMAKGLRFSAALTSGIRHQPSGGDSAGDEMLAEIAKFPASLRIGPPDAVTELKEAVLLSPYVSSAATKPGDEAAARLANLQRAYDRYVTDRFMTGATVDDPPYADISTIQASLDERTVLMCCYVGATSANKSAVYLLAITRTAIRMGSVAWNVQDVPTRFVADNIEVSASPIAGAVSLLRDRIQEYGGPDDPLSVDAARSLDGGLRGYLGNLPEYLAELRAAGKDHLCIVPHGPLHFLPFHAIRDNGIPLAETWVITYMPNMGLLFGHRGRPSIPPARDREMTSIGLTFQDHNPFGLSAMPQSGQEATSIAALFGTQPVLEGAATEAAVTHALQHSHYVHLSTHGRHDANAPSFQSLFVAPDDASDGIIHAYEILSLDLRGIDVLTLSACETALGRFDPGDNLRGLPASFLLAGVSTLIGTLWEVDAQASETFFVAFYTELRSGSDRRDAFSQAQRKTRSAFPRYSHWAAFCFIGAWK